MKAFHYIVSLVLVFLTLSVCAQTYTCTELSITREHKGSVKRKSYAVSSLFLKFTPDSIKIFGNYQGRYIMNSFVITGTVNDTILANGGFFKHESPVRIHIHNSILTSDYNFIDDTGESKVQLRLTLKPVADYFSEKDHERKKMRQSQPLRRDLLGRNPDK